jgi:uncharacterized protein (DUF2237 family)
MLHSAGVDKQIEFATTQRIQKPTLTEVVDIINDRNRMGRDHKTGVHEPVMAFIVNPSYGTHKHRVGTAPADSGVRRKYLGKSQERGYDLVNHRDKNA